MTNSRLKKSIKEGKNFVLPKTGSYQCRCLQVIDFGFQVPPNPAWTSANKMLIVWELVDTNHVFDEKVGAQPFVVNKDIYVDDVTEKNKAGKFFNLWIPGSVVTGKQTDFSNLVGAAGEITIVIVPKKTKPDEKKVDVSHVEPADGDKVAAVRNPFVYFEIGSNECLYKEVGGETQTLAWFDLFPKLYRWMQKSIANTDTFKDACREQNVALTFDSDGYPELTVGAPFDANKEKADDELTSDNPNLKGKQGF